MTKYSSVLIAILFPLLLSCGGEKDNAASNENESASQPEKDAITWKPSLFDDQKLLLVVRLDPGEIKPVKGIINTPGMYGIHVKEGWELKDRQDADGQRYWVYLRSSSSSSELSSSVGTIMGASTNFTPGEGISYELANETPIPVTVAIYSGR